MRLAPLQPTAPRRPQVPARLLAPGAGLAGLAALAALAGLCSTAALAQSGGPAACAALADDAARLACYDRAFGAAPAARPAAPGNGAAATTPPAPAPQTAAAAPAAARGPLGAAWSTGGVEPFSLRPYRSIYLLPVFATDRVNRRPSSPAPRHEVGIDLPNRAEEVKFQLSAKTLLWPRIFGSGEGSGDLWLAYTQSSRWQLYTPAISRPFRETNYEPELIFNVMLDRPLLGWTLRTAGLSLNHQSNGRALPLSRSWNRVIGHVGFERGDWSVVLRPWLRLRESADQDDNPDIQNQVGRADLTVRRELGGGSAVELRLRHTLRGGDASRGAAEFDWAFPISGRLLGHLQLSSGTGESLIDYNHRQNRIGIGISLARWD